MAVYQSTWMLKDMAPSLASQLPQVLQCVCAYQRLLDESNHAILQRLHASQRLDAVTLGIQLRTAALE